MKDEKNVNTLLAAIIKYGFNSIEFKEEMANFGYKVYFFRIEGIKVKKELVARISTEEYKRLKELV